MAGAPIWSKEIFAPVTISAVVFRSVGLAQPEVVCIELTKWQWLVAFMFKVSLPASAGSPRQAFGRQFLLSSLPPMVLLRVVPSLCPSFRTLQVELLWFLVTLYPWDQQYPFGS